MYSKHQKQNFTTALNKGNLFRDPNEGWIYSTEDIGEIPSDEIEPNMEYEYEAEDIYTLLQERTKKEFEKLSNVEILKPLEKPQFGDLKRQLMGELQKNDGLARTILIAYDLDKRNWIGLVIKIDYITNDTNSKGIMNVKVQCIIPSSSLKITTTIKKQIEQAYANVKIEPIDTVAGLSHPDPTCRGALTVENLINFACDTPVAKKLNSENVRKIRKKHIEIFPKTNAMDFNQKQRENTRTFPHPRSKEKVEVKETESILINSEDQDLIDEIINTIDTIINNYAENPNIIVLSQEIEELYEHHLIIREPLMQIFKVATKLSWDLKNFYSKVVPWPLLEHLTFRIINTQPHWTPDNKFYEDVIDEIFANDCECLRSLKDLFSKMLKKEPLQKEESKKFGVFRTLSAITYDNLIINNLIERLTFLDNLKPEHTFNKKDALLIKLAILRVLHCAGEYFKSLSPYLFNTDIHLPKLEAIDLRDALSHIDLSSVDLLFKGLESTDVNKLISEMQFFRNQLFIAKKRANCSDISWHTLRTQSVVVNQNVDATENYPELKILLQNIKFQKLVTYQLDEVKDFDNRIKEIVDTLLPVRSYEFEVDSMQKISSALRNKDNLDNFTKKMKSVLKESITEEQCKIIFEKKAQLKEGPETEAFIEKYALGLLQYNPLQREQLKIYQTNTKKLNIKRANLKDSLKKLKIAKSKEKNSTIEDMPGIQQKYFDKLTNDLNDIIQLDVSPNDYWQMVPSYLEDLITNMSGLPLENFDAKLLRRTRNIESIILIIYLIRDLLDINETLDTQLDKLGHNYEDVKGKNNRIKIKGYIQQDEHWNSYGYLFNSILQTLNQDFFKWQACEILLVIIGDIIEQAKNSKYPELVDKLSKNKTIRNYFAHPDPVGQKKLDVGTIHYDPINAIANEVSCLTINVKFILEQIIRVNKEIYYGISITTAQKQLGQDFSIWESGNLKTAEISVKSFFDLDEETMLEMAIQASLEDKNVSQNKENLKKVASGFGYECHDVLGDGNCFFYAVAHQLKRLGRSGQDIDPDILRILSAIEIDTNQERYKDFILEHERENYASNVAKPRTWVGLIVAQAIARIKNVIVAIISSDGGRPQIIKPSGTSEIIVLGNEVDIHFQSLIAKDPLLNNYLPEVPTDDLQAIIDDTPTLDSILYNNETKDIISSLSLTNPGLYFYRDLYHKAIIERRHEDQIKQTIYDKRFGLVIKK